MLSLFSLNPDQAGFRLDKVEIWNWGTFNDKIYTINPNGENSLLTGANGSGKTTFVHALLTLLASEKRMRSFNQSAEGKTKNERTEESYVTGEYGQSEDLATGTSKIQRLREDKAGLRSVLLAVFKNEDYYVTLVQVRWYAGSELKKAFIIAHKALGIEQDFRYFDAQGEWRKRLKQQYPKQGHREAIEFFDGPKEYGNRLRMIFGMRSEKAQSLFNQTISLKILGNLDEFVRGQMLEETDMEDEFVRLKAHFKTLSDAHRNIEKTQIQINLLLPVREKWNTLTNIDADRYQYQQHREILPAWFSLRQQQLLQKLMNELQQQIITTQNRKSEIVKAIDDLQEELFNIEAEIRSSDAGRRLQEIDQKIRELEAERKERANRKDRYNQWISRLGWDENPGEKEFARNREKAQQKKEQLQTEIEEKRQAMYRCQQKKDQVAVQMDSMQEEIEQLQHQKNNITGRVAQLRKEILEHTGATEEEIPFVGELIQLLPGEEHWEYAIEKLLHNFALRLLVPDSYYKAVNKYVNQTDLKGRIVYERYKEQTVLNDFFHNEADTVSGKLDVKDSSPYADWVRFQLSKYYYYRCTDNMNEFAKTDYALTSSGLVRQGMKHEKDDRPDRRGRQHYVLGWDSSAKIRALLREMDDLESQFQLLGKETAVHKSRVQQLVDQEKALDEVLRIDSYSALNWEAVATEIEQRDKEKKKLEKGSTGLAELKRQQENLAALLQKARQQQEDKVREEEQLKAALALREQQQRECTEVMQVYEGIQLDSRLAEFQQHYILPLEYEIDLDVIEKTRKHVSRILQQKTDSLSDQYSKTKTQLQRAMWEFKSPTNEKILKLYEDWRGDTHRLSDNPELAGEYIDLLERLEGEQLTEQKERFKKYLNEEMINRMSSFKEILDEQLHEILRNVEALNRSLKNISFRKNPETYIQLDAKEEYAPAIKDFRVRLTNWKPDLAEYHRTKDETILEDSYLLIKALLDEMDEKENWRREVTDVRQWLKFTAREVLKVDNTTYRTYTGTEKLSGGEQAQLTYTILGSAIAYQFGISKEGLDQRSFRFICVDEAFSRQDEEKARYLMDLCRQLSLQIMVVSPAKAEEVKIVEPYIARVHFVQRRNNRDSVLYDMPVMELSKLKG